MSINALFILAAQTGPYWDQMGKANEAASVCSIRAGVRLDDRKTSPDIVARGATATCYQELLGLEFAVRANIANEMPTMPDAQRTPVIAKQIAEMRTRIEDLTIQAILEQRRLKNASN